MKTKKLLCILFAVVCLVSCLTAFASAHEVEEVFLTDETIQNAIVPFAAEYTATEIHKFTSATIYNYGASTLYVTIGTYNTKVASGKGITLTYQTYATRTIELSSPSPLDYTISYD